MTLSNLKEDRKSANEKAAKLSKRMYKQKATMGAIVDALRDHGCVVSRKQVSRWLHGFGVKIRKRNEPQRPARASARGGGVNVAV